VGWNGNFTGKTVLRKVLIRGDGVAAYCCLRLLDRPNLNVDFTAVDRPKLPAIMLSAATQNLLRDVFEREDLFDGLPQVRKRIVAWGPDCKALAFPHSAVVVAEQILLDRIRQGLANRIHEDGGDAEWTIQASRPLRVTSVEHQFGSRIATASRVKLRSGHDRYTCWVESLDRGWLFLLPAGEETGWLLSVGDSTGSPLAESCLVAQQVAEVVEIVGQFPSHPRMTEPLSQPGWLACGTAAVGFDPLCGDGTGYATREAILGSAVVRGVAGGENVDAVVAHYRNRLVAGFKRHLEVCLEFYQTGGHGPWWNQEANALRTGLLWCRRQLDGARGFRYRLNGFSLEPID
jgi:hypothetical protein